MLDADATEQASLTSEDWVAWQQAAVDYWLVLHPDLRPFRRGDPSRVPTVEEMRERAELVATALDGIPDQWRLAASSRERAEHLARVGWFHELLAGLYGPLEHAMRRVGHTRPR